MTTAANPYASPQTTDLAGDRNEERAEPKILSYAGRLGRMRLVAYNFYMSLISIPLSWMAVGLMFSGSWGLGTFAYVAMLGISLVFGLSFYVRRLHDLNQAGLWVLLFLLPLVNLGLLVYLFFSAEPMAPTNMARSPPRIPRRSKPALCWRWCF